MTDTLFYEKGNLVLRTRAVIILCAPRRASRTNVWDQPQWWLSPAGASTAELRGHLAQSNPALPFICCCCFLTNFELGAGPVHRY